MGVSNSVQNVGTEVAAKVVERALGAGVRGSVAGLLVQPAVWIATDTRPNAADALIYGAGAIGTFAGAMVAVPALVTGVIKAGVDDHIQSLVDQAKSDEPATYRDAIYSVDKFDFFNQASSIQAMKIASYGGVVWQHPNGVYVFIMDKNRRLVCDYEPAKWKRLYAPELPLRRNGDRVAWRHSSK